MKNYFKLTCLFLYYVLSILPTAECSAIEWRYSSFEKPDTLGPCSVAIRYLNNLSNPPVFALGTQVAGVPPFAYKWTPFYQSEIGEDNLSTLRVWHTDDYCVIVKDASGCFAADCFHLRTDSLYCPVWISQENNADIANLSFYTPSDSVVSILWSTGETAPVIQPSTPGNYAVTVTNNVGCSSTAEWQVAACNQLDVWVEMADSLDGIAARVYLYQMGTTPPMLLDSALTDVATGVASFVNIPVGQYTVSAALLPSSPWYPQYLPVTFASDAAEWQQAQTMDIELFCDPYQPKPSMEVWMRKKAELFPETVLYPNPVTSSAFIDILNQGFYYRLTDMQGQVLGEANVSEQSAPYEVPMQQYNPGIYFMQIEVDGAWQVVRIVKM